MANGESSAQGRVLLVEGHNDMHVVAHLWGQRYNTGPDFRISVKDGIDELLQSIRGEILNDERTAVGILVDADDCLMSRWQAVTDKLKTADITPPPNPISLGTIIESNPRVGVWLMPDNQSPGELEDFIKAMIPPYDPVWPLSESYIDGIPQEDRKFTSGKTLRAKVNAWLATREDPRPMGTAIRAGDLDVNTQISSSFVNWLQQLFG